MEVAVANYDFFFWHIKAVSDDNHPLKDRCDRFLLDLKSDLVSNNDNLKKVITKRLSQIFDLRLDAIRFFAQKKVDILAKYSQELLPSLQDLEKVKNYSSLARSLTASFTLNKMVVESLTRNADFFNQSSETPAPNISFDQLQATIYYSSPNYEIANSTIDWINCSLFIEYIAIATYILYDERILITHEKINELNDLLDETNLAYATLAVEFNLIAYPDKILNLPKSNPKGASHFRRMLDEKKFIREHLKQGGSLADLKDKFNFGDPLYFRDK